MVLRNRNLQMMFIGDHQIVRCSRNDDGIQKLAVGGRASGG